MSEQSRETARSTTVLDPPVERPDRVLLSVHSLKTCFGSEAVPFPVVKGIDFEIRCNETFALIGESASRG